MTLKPSCTPNAPEQEFRQQVLQAFTDHKALDFMFETVKRLALRDLGAAHIENTEQGDSL
ncbi:hypothetical protein HC752_20500 [Vibrio sp. S9_S30]|nr:hypothetical protein [Vibrio sp. S9_S30]MBD1559326.1 hypothetical protein [Vibrio sp. S9_S30]